MPLTFPISLFLFPSQLLDPLLVVTERYSLYPAVRVGQATSLPLVFSLPPLATNNVNCSLDISRKIPPSDRIFFRPLFCLSFPVPPLSPPRVSTLFFFHPPMKMSSGRLPFPPPPPVFRFPSPSPPLPFTSVGVRHFSNLQIEYNNHPFLMS